MRCWQIVHFEEDEENASWFCGQSRREECRWHELPSWRCCRLVELTLTSSFLFRSSVKEGYYISSHLSATKGSGRGFFCSLLFYGWGSWDIWTAKLQKSFCWWEGTEASWNYGVWGYVVLPVKWGWGSEREHTEIQEVFIFQGLISVPAKRPLVHALFQSIYCTGNNPLAWSA